MAAAAVGATARLDPRCVADHDDDDVAQKRKKTLKCRHLKFRTQVALLCSLTGLSSVDVFPTFLLLFTIYSIDLNIQYVYTYVEHLL